MTDPLTDAVRRLKELQQDVERLKSSENEEGQPRLLFSAQETASISDAQTDIRSKQVDDSATYGSAGYNTSAYNS